MRSCPFYKTLLYGIEFFTQRFSSQSRAFHFHGLRAKFSREVFDKDILCLSVPNEVLTTVNGE